MTTSDGGVKNADTPGASNFDLYAGDFSCDDDISFENLLQLDNDIDKPPPSTLHQGSVSPSAQICRQPPPPPPSAINAAQPSAIAGSAAVPPAGDTVVYLLTTSALRPPSTAGGAAVYDAVARNDVRPLLRFQISKRPTATTVVGYGVELGGPIVTVASNPQQRAPVGLGVQTAAGCDLASITSIGDRVAALAAGCPSSPDAQQLQRRLTLTAAFNGDLSTATQRSIAAAVVAGTSPGARPAKPNQPLSGTISAGSSKSKSAAAADARQTVQEKNAYEYERVMDILRYYRELVVERKLPGACLPCKRRKSKPLVSADPVTSISTRPAPLPSLTSTIAARTVAVPTVQYIRPVAMSPWRAHTPATGMCLPLATSADKLPAVASSALSGRPPAPQTPTNGDTSTMSSADHDSTGRTATSVGELAFDEPQSRPSSVELGTVQSHPVNDDLSDCFKDFTRACSSAPGLYTDDSDVLRNSPTTVSDHKTPLHQRRRPLSALGGSRHRWRRRSVDLRRFVGRTPTFLHSDLRARKSQSTADNGVGGQVKDDAADSQFGVWMKPTQPVKHISTKTTDTVVTKWTKAHLAISGPYQSWT